MLQHAVLPTCPHHKIVWLEPHPPRMASPTATGVVLRDGPAGEHVLLEDVEPAVNDGPEGPDIAVAQRQSLDDPPVHGLRVVQRGSVSEICSSEVANPARRARSAIHRAARVLPRPHSPRNALNTAPPAATLASSSSRETVNRSSPTAMTSSPRAGIVPRRKALMISLRRVGLTSASARRTVPAQQARLHSKAEMPASVAPCEHTRRLCYRNCVAPISIHNLKDWDPIDARSRLDCY